MLKNRTNLILILSIILTLASVGTLIFIFKIIENKNQHTSKVIITLAEKIEKKENIDTLQKKIREIDGTKQLIDSYFVDPSKIDSFIDYLEKIGAGVGTDVKVEGFDATSQAKNILSVRLSIKGSFNNVIRTIMLLENAPYQITITKTNLNIENKTVTVDDQGNTKEISGTRWKANISFSVLMSS